ncbi:MAG: hypothetical protein AAF747_02230 [Planctomycetota bacterium]
MSERLTLRPIPSWLGRVWSQAAMRSDAACKRFTEQAGLFTRVLAHAEAAGDTAPWVTPLWEGFNAKAADRLCPVPPTDFLSIGVIRQSMFVDQRGDWLKALRERVPELLKHVQLATSQRDWLTDPALGRPVPAVRRPRTSHNTLHHAHHLLQCAGETGTTPWETSSIIEWGGGFGNLARLIMSATDSPPAYTIIDTPLFVALQWAYLSAIFGGDRVGLRTSAAEAEPDRGNISLVPVAAVSEINLTAELLVSTWALSECPAAVQARVANDFAWFGADRLLLASQDPSEVLPDAGCMRELATEAGATTTAIDFLPGNSYSFK